MLTVEQARARVLESFEPLDEVELPLADAAGYAVAADVAAPHPLPRFDNSAMDGYAVVGADVREASEPAPVSLRLIGEVRAGDPGELKVAAGEAARIMTGAPLPPGADTIAQVEITREEDGSVIVQDAVEPGTHVRPAGQDVAAGEVVVTEGTELGPGEIAILASLGVTPVQVRRAPRVAVMSTGDELVDVGEDPGPGRIRDSNTPALCALVAEAGGEPIAFARIPDDRAAVLEAFERAAAECDLLVSSGGVSVGRYDLVKEAVEALGHIDLWRVAMQPGKPVVLGAVRSTPFLGLPGNPVSIHVGFEQFVRPALRKMRGCARLLRPMIRARLTRPLRKRPGRLHFVRVRLSVGEHGFEATPTGPQGSHIQSSLVGCDGLARFGLEEESLEEGAEVEVEVWRLPPA